ncbi:hypothetical protein T492DRAFT_839660 [Pavlovales sp. CCMP2436]|nr:hypothetical protein T492DRAFT_839660 [Pavlovales sp. CCMP2436]
MFFEADSLNPLDSADKCTRLSQLAILSFLTLGISLTFAQNCNPHFNHKRCFEADSLDPLDSADEGEDDGIGFNGGIVERFTAAGTGDRTYVDGFQYGGSCSGGNGNGEGPAVERAVACLTLGQRVQLGDFTFFFQFYILLLVLHSSSSFTKLHALLRDNGRNWASRARIGGACGGGLAKEVRVAGSLLRRLTIGNTCGGGLT